MQFNITKNWKKIIEDYDKEQEINFNSFIENENQKFNLFPCKDNIFRCFNYFDIENTKIVILGQDPYHGPNQATGLCFETNKNCKFPPTLKNIEKLLNKKADFEKWANQGVLLLNTSLSVLENKPGSHIKYWLPFTKYIITKLNEICNNIIFIIWGLHAYQFVNLIDNNKHKIYISSHPSPLSCHKKLKNYTSFNDSDIFNKIDIIQW